jgi:hypothetical protein
LEMHLRELSRARAAARRILPVNLLRDRVRVLLVPAIQNSMGSRIDRLK